MGIIDRVTGAAVRAVQTVERAAEEIVAPPPPPPKPSAPNVTSAFEKDAPPSLPNPLLAKIDVEGLRKNTDPIIKEELKARALTNPQEVEDAIKQLGYFEADDVCAGVVNQLSNDDLIKMAGAPEGRAVLEKMKSEIDDINVDTAHKVPLDRLKQALNGTLKADPPAAPKVDPNSNRPAALQGVDYTGPHLNGDGGDYVTAKNERGVVVHNYKTGDNVTKVPEGELDNPPADLKPRQAEVLVRMTAVLAPKKVDVPPTLAQAKEYFQKIAGKGTPKECEELKNQLHNFLDAFYVHAGQGVDWKAGNNLANDLERSFAMQPVLKDGRRVIDCEGFAALTENLLKDIKDPKGQPMFDLMQGQTPNHAIIGVFRHGKPFEQPFMVSNAKTETIPPDDIKRWRGLTKKGESVEAQQKFILRQLVEGELRAAKDNTRPTIKVAPRMDQLPV